MNVQQQSSCFLYSASDYTALADVPEILSKQRGVTVSHRDTFEEILNRQLSLYIKIPSGTKGVLVTQHASKSASNVVSLDDPEFTSRNTNHQAYHRHEQLKNISGLWKIGLGPSEIVSTRHINPLICGFGNDGDPAPNYAGCMFTRTLENGDKQFTLISKPCFKIPEIHRMFRAANHIIRNDASGIKGVPPADIRDDIEIFDSLKPAHRELIHTAIRLGRFVNCLIPSNCELFIETRMLDECSYIDWLKIQIKSIDGVHGNELPAILCVGHIILGCGFDENALVKKHKRSGVGEYLERHAELLGYECRREALVKALNRIKLAQNGELYKLLLNHSAVI